MEQIANNDVGISVPSGNRIIADETNLPEPSNTLEHIGLPVRRVLKRALAKTRLRALGLPDTDANAVVLSRPKGRVR